MNHDNQKLADKLARQITRFSRPEDLCCHALEDGGIVIRTWCCDAARGADYVKLLDPGEVTASLVYDPTDASHKRLARYMKNRITANFKICEVSTGGSVSSFTGYVKAMSREIPMDDVITCDVTFKVSGLPGYTT
jgi:hypothetical protein